MALSRINRIKPAILSVVFEAPPELDWILATGFWDDTGAWDDTANWID